MTGNTDDHLKNFCMLHDEQGWRLSPAFDLVPNIGLNQGHVSRIGLYNRPDGIESVLPEAKYFGIKRRQKALDIATEVYDVVSGWQSVFTEFGVPDNDAKIIGKDIDKRLQEMRPDS